MIYALIFIYIFFLTYYYDFRGGKVNKKIAYYSLLIIFICLSGFRYHIGIDTFQYRTYWDMYPDFLKFNWIEDIEKFRGNSQTERYHAGWIIYVMFLRIFSKNFIILQISNAIIVNYAIFRTIKKYSPYPFLTLLLFACSFTFVEFEFELMRESIAVSIFLLFALENFINKRWIPYFIATMFAYLVHPSAMMMFALPLVRNLKWPTKTYLLYLIIPSIVLGVVGHALIGDALNLLLGEESYASNYFGNVEEHNSNYILMYDFKPTIFLLLILIFHKKIDVPSYLIPIFYFSIFFMYLGGLVYTAQRFVNYIIIVDYIFLTYIVIYICKKTMTLWASVVVSLILYTPNIYQYSGNPLNIARHYPYRSYLNPTPTSDQIKFEKSFYWIGD